MKQIESLTAFKISKLGQSVVLGGIITPEETTYRSCSYYTGSPASDYTTDTSRDDNKEKCTTTTILP